MGGPDVDVVITEIGGTVGDIESLPFLEAARQVRHDVGRDNVLLPARLAGALHRPVRRAEDQADPALGRRAALDRHPARRDRVPRRPRRSPTSIKRKISLMCDVDEEAVVTAADAPSIYDIPKVLHREGLDAYVVRRLDLPFRDVDWTVWDDLLRGVHHPTEEVTVALVGKYIDLPDAYLSVAEALRAGGFAHEAKVNIALGRLRRVPDAARAPPGTSPTSTRSACPAASASAASRASSARCTYARDARHPDPRPVPRAAVHGDRVRPQRGRHRRAPTPPSSTPTAPSRSSRRWPSRSSSSRAPATWAARCGSGSTRPSCSEGSVVRAAYGEAKVEERHRHRYEVNNAYRDAARGGRPGVLRHLAGQQPGRVRRAARATCTPTTSPPRRTPSCARARPGRTRCSPGLVEAAIAAAARAAVPDRRVGAASPQRRERRGPHGARRSAPSRAPSDGGRPTRVLAGARGGADLEGRRALLGPPRRDLGTRPPRRAVRAAGARAPGRRGDPRRRRGGAGAGPAPVPPPRRDALRRAAGRPARRRGRGPGRGGTRELQEEALLLARTWTHLFTTYSSPGLSSERIAYYLAQDLRRRRTAAASSRRTRRPT